MLKMKLDLQFFASGTITGSIVKSSSGTKLQMKIDWSSVENVSANTSTITTKLYGRRADSLSGATSERYWKGSVQVGSNTAHTFSDMGSSWANKEVYTSWVLFKTYTDTITHNPDGTKSVTISGSLTGPTGTSLSGIKSSASGTATLGTIPRGSTLGDIEDFSIDDTITIPITKYVETYVDNLVISCGETTIKTIDAIVDGTEITFTEEEKNVIRSLMTSPKLELTFTLTTLNETETMGTSIKTARVSSFDKPIAFNVKKTDSGHYRWAFNGLIDDEIDSPFQIYDDEGNEILREKVLYSNDTGVAASITLNESAENFRYLVFMYFSEYGQTVGGCRSVMVYEPNGKVVELNGDYDNGSFLYMCNAKYTISGTSVTKNSEVRWRLTPSSSSTTNSRTNATANMKIYKVIGRR